MHKGSVLVYIDEWLNSETHHALRAMRAVLRICARAVDEYARILIAKIPALCSSLKRTAKAGVSFKEKTEEPNVPKRM